MIVFFGTRPRGRVHVAHGGFVETDFFCIQWLPIVPLRSHFVDANDGSRRALRTVPASVIAGYVRGWFAGPAVVLLAAAFWIGVGQASIQGAASLLLFAAVFAIPVWGARYIGRLSENGTLEREAYARACGAAVDVALLEEWEQSALRDSLLAKMDTETRALMSESYRGGVRDPDLAYVTVATGPATPSLDYLCGALALTRLDAARAREDERESLRQSHEAIFARVRSFAAD